MRTARLLTTLLLLASTAFAVEVAELRNGFSIRHYAREQRDGQMRLYLDEQKKSFVDVPADQIERYSTEAEPDPKPESALSTEPAKPAAEVQPAPAPQKSTNQIVAEASARHGIDSDFIRSVIHQESGGNAHAVSRAGAQGLMQLMPATAAKLGVHDSFSAEENVHGGTRYLREMLERYHGDAIKALAAYNAGPDAVDRYHGIPPYRETQAYVRRVVLSYNKSKEKPAPKQVPPATQPEAQPKAK